MWRTHKNRVDRGLGGTYHSSGYHESMDQDSNFLIPNFTVTLNNILYGSINGNHMDNPFIRWHQSFDDYSSFHNDMDDIPMHITDEFERFKKFKADPKKVAGATPVIMREDNDEKFEFWDIQGESIYSHPPEPNTPTIDHGLDEDLIWNFPRTLYNQESVKNMWTTPGNKANYKSFAPHWGHKLAMPAWYKPEKMPKFFRHWDHRLGLQSLHIKHAMRYGADPTPEQQKIIENEVNAYINACYDYEEKLQFKDVYVTDHQLVPEKLLTQNEEEDLDFFEYQKSLEEYNTGGAQSELKGGRKPLYERGSLLQKMIDPLAGAPRDQNGSVVYTVEDKELEGLLYHGNEEKLRAQYEALKNK